MTNEKMKIRGVIPPLVTPLQSDDKLDKSGLKKLLNHLMDGGIHGVFILGTTGEGSSLSNELKKDVIDQVCQQLSSKIPVLVSITDPSIITSIRLAEYAAKCGADAVVIAPPYYFPLDRKEFETYLTALSRQLPLPFMLYNMPIHTKLNIPIETVKLARELGAIGIKDSSGDVGNLMHLISVFKDDPDFSVISGSEILLPETIMAGGDGVIAGGANLFPRLYVELYNASLSKNLERITHLKNALIQIENSIYSVGSNYSKTISGIKCALSILDICNDHPIPPILGLDDLQRLRMRDQINKMQENYRPYIQSAVSSKQ